MSWAEFFAMGGYALYVWGAYTFAAAVLALNVIVPLRRGKAVRAALREFHRLQGRTR